MFIGREIDASGAEREAELPTDRLRRHAVLLGMTGSGKTGLLITLLEEVARAGVPVIALDPKGDLTNLALPLITAPEFAPWAEDADEAASKWRDGLAGWGIDQRAREAWAEVPVTVYTPGSTAGRAVDVLTGLSAPPAGVDEEALRALVSGTISALLGLIGAQADPLTDPGHVVLSMILERAWAAGEGLSLERLLPALVDPPFPRAGVFPVEDFLPRRERVRLAMRLNAVVASPAFAPWSEGDPLDVDALLAGPGIHVFYTAHLAEGQREFFSTLLLDRVLAWSRRQAGSDGLRAVLAMDEALGLAPPHPANPGTKAPLLTLMKQARAVGLGLVLATQNPVDLDYKALSNAGLWISGRLQTRQDRERVAEGLGEVDLAELPARVFALRDVRQQGVRTLRSRWALSYLRGPLTLAEVGRLAPPPPQVEEVMPVICPIRDDAPGLSKAPPPAPEGVAFAFLDPEVIFSAAMEGAFEGLGRAPREDGVVVWEPALLARLSLRFDEGRDFVEQRDELRVFYPLSRYVPAKVLRPPIERAHLLREVPSGYFPPLPEHLDTRRELDAERRRVADEVLRGETTERYLHRGLRLSSRAGEARVAFEARVREAVEARTAEAARALQARYQAKAAALEAKRERLELQVEHKRAAARDQAVSEALGAGEMVLGLLLGRRRALAPAARRRGQTKRAQERAEAVEASLDQLRDALLELELDLSAALEALRAEHQPLLEGIETQVVGLERDDILLSDYTILWLPLTRPV